MFERYTEKARRTIFFARYAASDVGSPKIESEHLLLGILHESEPIPEGSQGPDASWAMLVRHKNMLCERIAAHSVIREPIPDSVDIPLSDECHRVLAHAAEEAERLSHKHIGIDHLLLGLLREKDSFAAKLLHETGAVPE